MRQKVGQTALFNLEVKGQFLNLHDIQTLYKFLNGLPVFVNPVTKLKRCFLIKFVLYFIFSKIDPILEL